jgi:hypothetical protein
MWSISYITWWLLWTKITHTNFLLYLDGTLCGDHFGYYHLYTFVLGLRYWECPHPWGLPYTYVGCWGYTLCNHQQNNQQKKGGLRITFFDNFWPIKWSMGKVMVISSSWCHSYLVVCVKVKLNMYILISHMVALNIIMNRFIDHSCLTFKNSSSSSLLDMDFKEKQITLIAFFKIVIEIVLVEGDVHY